MVNASGFLSSFHQCSILIIMLMLSEGQAGEDWEPPNKAVLFGNGCVGGGGLYKEDYFDIHVSSDTELSF
jgi:hypothetical protein